MLWQNSKSSSDEIIGNRGSSCRHIFSWFGVGSSLCITSRLFPGAASRLSSCSFTVCKTGAPALAIFVLSPTWGPLGTTFMLHECECSSVSRWGRPGAVHVHRLPACVSGAHGAVDDWWLSCVEVGWWNGLQHLACLPNPVLTPRGSLKPPIFCFNGTENGPAFPFLLYAFSSQRLRLFIWDFSLTDQARFESPSALWYFLWSLLLRGPLLFGALVWRCRVYKESLGVFQV